jgi:hypothetical protein
VIVWIVRASETISDPIFIINKKNEKDFLSITNPEDKDAAIEFNKRFNSVFLTYLDSAFVILEIIAFQAILGFSVNFNKKYFFLNILLSLKNVYNVI